MRKDETETESISKEMTAENSPSLEGDPGAQVNRPIDLHSV
jgi:hypothetical protein